MSELIKVQDVHKTYATGDQPFVALRGVSLSIQPGEFVAIMGRPAPANLRCCTCSAGWIGPRRVRSWSPASLARDERDATGSVPTAACWICVSVL